MLPGHAQSALDEADRTAAGYPPPSVAVAVHVGRQAIVDTARATYGYELLFRALPVSTAAGAAGEAATSQVIVDTFTEFGLERLVGEGRAFVTVTRPFLVGELALPFGGGPTVLELLPAVPADKR